jgi:regulator of PEP synthase PpsR (kinase-PPPase family)
VAHDDGRNPQDLAEADIVLVGVSRTSKTPLSMYLSFSGYKVANVPLAKGTEPPAELFDVEPFRIFGLLSTPQVLSTVRNERLGSLEAREVAGSYADPACIEAELEEARALMRRLGCIVIHTNGRAVEETSQVILGYYQRAEAAWEKRRQALADAAERP